MNAQYEAIRQLGVTAENARVIGLLNSFEDNLQAQGEALTQEGLITQNVTLQLSLIRLLRETIRL